MKSNTNHMEMNDDLLISYLLKEVSDEQARLVKEWRAASEANEQRFGQFRLIWETSKKFRLDDPADASDSLQRLKQKAAQPLKVKKLYPGYGWLRIAAAVLLLAGGAWIYFGQRAVKQLQFATADTVKTDTLSDGSVITLNKYALLQYPEKFNGKQRNVILKKGEAFFSVAHDKAKPFIITAGGTAIRVVGTSFNVKNKNGTIEVIVETGIVQVSRNGSAILLKPGERILVEPGTRTLIKAHISDHLYTYYRNREFVADNVPLWRMVQVLNEAYDTNIIIGRKELKDLPLNTTFKNESLDDVLAVISRTFKISVEKRNDQIILK
ncbi:MAG: FecR family protein [Mucilaginibacter sp.]